MDHDGITHIKLLNTTKTITHGNRNPDPDLGQTQKCEEGNLNGSLLYG